MKLKLTKKDEGRILPCICGGNVTRYGRTGPTYVKVHHVGRKWVTLYPIDDDGEVKTYNEIRIDQIDGVYGKDIADITFIRASYVLNNSIVLFNSEEDRNKMNAYNGVRERLVKFQYLNLSYDALLKIEQIIIEDLGDA